MPTMTKSTEEAEILARGQSVTGKAEEDRSGTTKRGHDDTAGINRQVIIEQSGPNRIQAGR